MKNWIASLKGKLGRHLVVPIMAIAMVGSFVTYDFIKAMPAKAAAAMAARPDTARQQQRGSAALARPGDGNPGRSRHTRHRERDGDIARESQCLRRRRRGHAAVF